jgi:Domain of unknown function (DUF4082)
MLRQAVSLLFGLSLAFLVVLMQAASAQTIQIGETAVLTNGDNSNGNLLLAQAAALPEPATIESLSFYVTKAGGQLILGVYDSSGPSGGPGVLLAQTATFTPVKDQWNTQGVTTPVMLPSGNYWLAYLPSSNTLSFEKQNNSGSCAYYSYTFGPMPSTFSTSPSSCTPTTWSFYASLMVRSGSSGDNIFGNVTPGTAAVSSTAATTLGLKFYSTQAGTIEGIRFYRGYADSAGYTASLYTSSGGSMLGQAIINGDVCTIPCWEQAYFSSPIPIAANTTYVATYYASDGRYADDQATLTNGVTNGPLVAPASSAVGGNGLYIAGNKFPTKTLDASNYYVDVMFTPNTPVLSLSFNPPNPSIPANAPAGTVVTTIVPSWSNGATFTGTLSFGSAYSNDNGIFAISGSNLVISTSATGLAADGGTIQDVTVVATQ